MKKIIILLLLLQSFLVFGNPIDSLTAKTIAINLLKYKENKNYEVQKHYNHNIVINNNR